MSQCSCQPCPEHDSLPEQEFRNANAKRAAYEMRSQPRKEVVLSDIVPEGAHQDAVVRVE